MKVLVSPLDWGLGHATRLVPVVGKLLAEGHDVVLAGSGASLRVLQGVYPQLRAERLPSFSPWFSRRVGQWLCIALQVPRFVACVVAEHFALRRIVARLGIQMVVSDNRYGLYHSDCRSVLITHQLSPKVASWAPRWFERLFARSLAVWVDRFGECWVPDFAIGEGLSGELSENRYAKVPVKCIGLLSMVADACEDATDELGPVEYLAVISGPEPQRSEFERLVVKAFAASGAPCVVVRGMPSGTGAPYGAPNIRFVNHCSPSQMKRLMLSARHIVCRSGYSTVMDLYSIGRRALLVPTPGQAEQEYLAQHLSDFGFCSISQKMLSSQNFLCRCP